MTLCVHFQLMENNVDNYTGRLGQIEMMVNEGLHEDTVSGPVPQLGVAEFTILVWKGPHSDMKLSKLSNDDGRWHWLTTFRHVHQVSK